MTVASAGAEELIILARQGSAAGWSKSLASQFGVTFIAGCVPANIDPNHGRSSNYTRHAFAKRASPRLSACHGGGLAELEML
jgi:hypothetical protein